MMFIYTLFQDEPIITKHAWLRFAQRTDLPTEEIPKFVRNSILFGYRYNHFEGDFRRFLMSKIRDNCQAIVYSGVILIFTPTLELLTVYKLPQYWMQWWVAQQDPVLTPDELNASFYTRLFAGIQSVFGKKNKSGKKRNYWR